MAQKPDIGKPSTPNNRKVIHNGTILTMDGNFTSYPGGMILIEDNSIAYVGPHRRELVESLPPDRIIDAEKGIVIPGFINTHTHIGMSLFRTLADDRADRLKRVLLPMENRLVEPGLVYWASLHTIAEMLLGGTTTFADMYFFEEMTARAADRGGMRAVVGQSLSSAPGPDAAGAEEGLERTAELVREFRGKIRIIPAVAPHAPYSLSRKDLERAARFAAAEKLPVLSHLAEMPFEESFVLEKYGMKPVPFYDECGLLTPRATMAHCIFADEEDRALLIGRDTGIAHNPSANAKSGKGIAPAYEFYREGARIGAGTDGPMSGNTMDMVHQLGMVSKLQKIRHGDPTVMDPRQVLAMATCGGARALHLEEEIGSLEPGKRADITVVSTDSPALFPVYDPYSALVYCAAPSDVSLVMVDGEVLMKKRKLLHLDTLAVREASREWIDRIRRETADLL